MPVMSQPFLGMYHSRSISIGCLLWPRAISEKVTASVGFDVTNHLIPAPLLFMLDISKRPLVPFMRCLLPLLQSAIFVRLWLIRR